MKTRAVVKGIGHGLPAKVLTNDDLSKIVETNDEWITQRTGIKERRICALDEAASDLSVWASVEALDRSGLSASEVDLVVVATVSGDFGFPATASLVQEAIGAHRAAAFDLNAACAGFIYGLSTAGAYIESGHAQTVLVVGVDTLSKFVDWSDRSTCVLFGDAAGAVVLQGEAGSERGLIHTVLFSDGSGAAHIIMPGGGSRHPYGTIQPPGQPLFINMNGNETYRFAVNALGDACCRVLEQAGMTASDVDLFVPHQANIRIIESAAEKVGLPPEKVFLNISKYGNTSAGSIPLGLYEAERDGKLKKGDVVMTVGFGAGLVWGANLIRW